MNVVLIVPTGLGCEIGGHAGDASPAAKLIAKCCDKFITHPNVVNASDINEMPDNALYVEGSILDRFLRGEIFLEEVYYNKILLVGNKPIANHTINSINAAISTVGAQIDYLGLDTPLKMTGFYTRRGKATGKIEGWLELCEQVELLDYDALAITSFIEVPKKIKLKYLSGIGGVNPWGGVEAMASKLIASKLDKPVAHAPYAHPSTDDLKDFDEVVDPRMSAEVVSMSYLHCVLKGLHKAPRLNYQCGLSVKDVDFLISPIGCVGEPHWACEEAGIPIIVVRENKCVLNDPIPPGGIVVDNYVEAAGVLMAYRAGIDWKTVRRFATVLELKVGDVAYRRNSSDKHPRWVSFTVNETYLELMKEYPEDYRRYE